MKKRITVLVTILCRALFGAALFGAALLSATFPLPAQDYDWDEFSYDDFDYDWGAEMEDLPDFVDPYAPAPEPAPAAPPPAAPAQAPAPAAPPPAPAAPPPAAPALAPAPATPPPSPAAPLPEAPALAPAPVDPPPSPAPPPPEYAALEDTAAEPEQTVVEGVHYRVVSDGDEADAALLLKELELRLELYNRLFRFETAGIDGPLQVRSIADAGVYEAYVRSRLDQAPPGAVYIHYNRPDRRELVINRGSAAEAEMVSHQAFIQCFRAFIPNPPSWMNDGFAILFSSLRFDPESEELTYDENLAWLDTVKKLGGGAAPPGLILLADDEAYSAGSIDNFKPLSWALASFLLNSGDEDYFRSLTEMFMALSPNASAAENSRAAARRLTLWTDFEELALDCQSYLEAKKSFAELVGAGQQAYGEGDFENAERLFAQARSMRPGEAAPCYYLALLAYGAKDYARAEDLYNAALYNGADPALVHYALGLNAVSAGRADPGIRWLEQAAEAAPDRFREKAERIIGRLR
jgi:tetratricopeptide (TPR) repeat protein